MNKMLATSSKGKFDTPNLGDLLNLESGKNYIWYIGGKELNSTYSYCANTKENALKINPYPEYDFEIPETVICIGIATSEMKPNSIICASFNHLKLN